MIWDAIYYYVDHFTDTLSAIVKSWYFCHMYDMNAGRGKRSLLKQIILRNVRWK